MFARLLFLAAALCATASARDIQSLELTRPEGARHFLLVESGKPAGKRPLVILLHGHTGTAAQLLGQGRGAAPLSVWLDIADREGLLLIAADGAKGSDKQPGWNDCRSDAASNPHTDDVGFIAALIDHAVAKYRADPSRVYVMGMSNGGMMTFRLAAELPAKITAIAAVSSSMAAKSSCAIPPRPLSVLIISGDADPLMPFTGGDVTFFSSKSRGSVVGIETAAKLWRELNQLPAQPSISESLPHRDAADPTAATRTIWSADPKRHQVELMRISRGGHVEPSARQRIGRLYQSIVGPQNGDFEAAEEAWAFFRDKTSTER